MLVNSKPVIFGLEATSLNDDERRFFEEVKPLGFILFARNVDNAEQVTALVSELKTLLGWDCPILIDQEGGRVARLRAPHWPEFPAMGEFTAKIEADEAAGLQATKANAASIAKMLKSHGIQVNCAPVADLCFEATHDIIGDRSFGSDVELVAKAARAVAEGHLAEGVLPIIKHIPGHGRALCDSHEELPVVDAPLELLRETDFAVFKALNDQPWAMTAHIIYYALDAGHPATQSAEVIRYIREDIGFKGVIVTDDLSMKALRGTYQERAAKALAAGCDVALHCNGKMEEMRAVNEGLSPMTADCASRLAHSFALIG